MRLWTLSPGYLDPKGLVACWREALLAQNVLLGETRGYKHHPQLERFRAQPDAVLAISEYLRGLQVEAVRRGYYFDESKIRRNGGHQPQIPVKGGQVEFEFRHLMWKLEARDPERARILSLSLPDPLTWHSLELHPLFRGVEGGIESWERT